MLAAAGLVALSALPARASSAAPGNISYILPTAYSAVLFNHSGARTTAPSCQGSAYPTRWAIDVTTPAGQAIVAVLISAYSMNKQITVAGSGTCTVQSDTETVYFIQIQN